MKRLLTALGVLPAILVGIPPLSHVLFPGDAAHLPPEGDLVGVASDTRVNVIASGEGPPAVLVHGLPGTAYDWRPLIAALVERRFRVIAYDRVGFGHSDPRPDDEYTLAADARDLLALLDVEDLRNATIVGWSFGGVTAMTAALEDPERIARLVLIGSAGRWPDAPSPSPLFWEPVFEWIAAVPPARQYAQRAMERLFFSGRPSPEWFSEQNAANLAQVKTRRAWREELTRYRYDGPDPSSIARPILVIHGEDDRVVPPSVGTWLHHRAVGSGFLLVEAGSHMLPVTHPDLLADRIADFASTDS